MQKEVVLKKETDKSQIDANDTNDLEFCFMITVHKCIMMSCNVS